MSKCNGHAVPEFKNLDDVTTRQMRAVHLLSKALARGAGQAAVDAYSLFNRCEDALVRWKKCEVCSLEDDGGLLEGQTDRYYEELQILARDWS